MTSRRVDDWTKKYRADLNALCDLLDGPDAVPNDLPNQV
jgi:hypothetical protein